MSIATNRLVLIASLTAAAGAAHAQLIAYDGFNYPAFAPLIAPGNGGQGWAAQWSPAYGASWITDTVGAGYAVGGYSLQRIGRRITGTHGGCQRSIALGAPLGNATETVWVSFIAQQTSGGTSQNWLGVKLPSTPGAGVDSFLFIGKPYTRAAWGLDPGAISRHLIGSNPVYTKSFVVARVDLRPGLDDVRVWVNPGLNGTPTNGSASVTALNVGNFQGITKVIAEIGSTSGVAAGNIDELRIGRSYADVAPRTDGIMFNGRSVTTLGNAEASVSNGALLVTNIGSTGNDGVQMSMDSYGSELMIDDPTLANGQSITTTNVNSLGNAIITSSLQKNGAGSLQTSADFSGIPEAEISSVRVRVYDRFGNVLDSYSIPGESATANIDAMIAPDDSCPFQHHPTWVRRTIYITNTDNTKTAVVYYERVCVSDFSGDPVGPFPYMTFEATFASASSGDIDNGDTKHLTVSTSGINELAIQRASGIYRDATITGLGDVFITEACSDGSNCADTSQRRVFVESLGVGGPDGAQFSFTEPAKECVYLWIDPPPRFTTTANAQANTTMQVTTPQGATRSASVTSTPDGLDGVNTTIDASQLGATLVQYTVKNNGVVVGSGVTPINGLVVHSDPGTWTSNDWYVYWWFAENGWGTTWTSPFDPNKFAFVINPGSGMGSGNELSLTFINGDQVSALNGLSITTENIAGPFVIGNLSITPVSPPCRADFNQDGFLDFFDYDAFVGAFESGGLDADFNTDGFLDFFDYDVFVGEFEAGC